MQAKDITDERAIAAIREAMKRDGRGVPADIWEVADVLHPFPLKVVAAKMRRLIKRGVITGCPCGKCRGDYTIVNDVAEKARIRQWARE